MTKTYAELLREARETVPQTTPAAAAERAATGALMLDVREPHEWEGGHVPGALFVPLGQLEERIDAGRARQGPAGGRLLRVRRALARRRPDPPAAGLQDVASMAGGIEAWKPAGPAGRGAHLPHDRPSSSATAGTC